MKTQTILFAAALLLSAGCAHVRYYSPVLLVKNTSATYDPAFSNAVTFKVVGEEQEKDSVEIRVQKIFPGFLHRELDVANMHKQEKAQAYKNIDLWVVLEAEGLVGNDIFESKIEKKAVFSHVVLNASSYDAVDIAMDPVPVPLNKVTRVKLKIYAIDKFLLKKALYQAKDKSLSKWVVDSITGLKDALNNALTKEAFEFFATATDQSSNVEQFLISAGSNIEFCGVFDIVPSKETGATHDTEIALYDKIKSEADQMLTRSTTSSGGLAPVPSSKSDYDSGYLWLHQAGIVLKDSVPVEAPSLDELKKSFVMLMLERKKTTALKAF